MELTLNDYKEITALLERFKEEGTDIYGEVVSKMRRSAIKHEAAASDYRRDHSVEKNPGLMPIEPKKTSHTMRRSRSVHWVNWRKPDGRTFQSSTVP